MSHPQADDAPKFNVLVVDDSAVDRHLAATIVGKLEHWHATQAANGREALEKIAAARPDVVLTDMLMPEMDGLQLVEAIRDKYPGLPVILMTAHGSEEVAIQALQKGAASYVPKKHMARDLADTVAQVHSFARTGDTQRRALDCLQRLEMNFTLDNDTTLIPALVGHIEESLTRIKLSQPSGLVLVGVALHEALTNAMIHGNLGVTSDLREVDDKQYHALIAARKQMSPYRDRRVIVLITLTREEATFVIRDEGEGFDPAILPDPTDPSNLGRVSGRGLLLIQTFMDSVWHNEMGSEITMVKRGSVNN